MSRRSLSGLVALGFFAVAFVLIAVAFATPSWLVSDYRITGAKLNRFGLWTHCFRSLSDLQDPHQKRFFVGCRWIYDPFTTGYDELRGYLLPDFMIATQFFFTVCFICMLIGAVLSLLYFLCCGPDMDKFVLLIKVNAIIVLVGAICGAIAVIVFASLGNRGGWMPGHSNNFFGWSFALACIGVLAAFVSATLFFVETNIQTKKKENLKESQSRFELDTKA
ncbi:hypothetical protein RN001_008674 [Aquatica leii]|uniref:Uncharacterized protein n=1 Tax=Aquatica leii TaxID=1421715 RepID=A0AAN7SPC0_9COLE|nr:hypothetical protein RN001_008674 [Aquatica leii]